MRRALLPWGSDPLCLSLIVAPIDPMAVGPDSSDASFATCLCTADGVMAPSATHICCYWWCLDASGLASMGLDLISISLFLPLALWGLILAHGILEVCLCMLLGAS